jgi:hypothetical protein
MRFKDSSTAGCRLPSLHNDEAGAEIAAGGEPDVRARRRRHGHDHRGVGESWAGATCEPFKYFQSSKVDPLLA